jgi:hypothetical protein
VFYIKNKNNMNLKDSQLDVDNWIEHGVRYFNELTNMAQLTEGEVARIIARRYGEQSEKER